MEMILVRDNICDNIYCPTKTGPTPNSLLDYDIPPVKWFESVIGMGNKLAPAEMFVGGDFTHHTVKYHKHLAELGMTHMSDPNEYMLLNQTSASLDRN
jgi:hypothetical protein